MIFALGILPLLISFPIAWSECVLPKPEWEYINKGFNLFGGDIGKQKHKYFIVDKFYDTDYKKISNGGLMEHKYFDLYDKLGEEKMPNIEILADRLQEIEWE